MYSNLFVFSLAVTIAAASVVPPVPYGWGTPGWDYGVHPHPHHVPVATSYASVWKVDHSVPVVVKPVVVKPVAPWWPEPAWDPHSAWASLPPPPPPPQPEPYGPHY